MIETNLEDIARLEKSFSLEKVFSDYFQINIINPKRISLKILLIYVSMALLWILVNIIIFVIISSGKKEVMFISTIKGSVYIGLTEMLFFVVGYFSIRRLITTYNKHFKEYERKLHKLQYHDKLTGLYNRQELKERLDLLIKHKNDRKSALMFIDIDNFKNINDTMGHTIGDLLLIKVSERVLKLHKTNCTFYRLGGDEFAVLLEGIADSTEAKALAVEIFEELNSGFEVDNICLFITLSAGISLYNKHGANSDDFMKNADIALYKAKESGRNRMVFYNEQMNEAVTERMKIEKNLRTALENDEFQLHYQPQLDIKTNKISGFEALIRWKSSQLGLVAPLKFIGIAEDTNLIIPIGEWVLRNACLFLKKLQENGYTDLNISVNVSIIQLLQENFVDIVLEVLHSMKLNPKQLELEITESILMESYEVIKDKLKILREQGIKIALDDFGKGYSSLNYLKQLPITTLKIDKSFIDTISNDDNNKSLINIIVEIGENMDLNVIAEGVETQEQMDYLMKCRCDKIQGYLFSKPITECEAYKKVQNKG